MLLGLVHVRHGESLFRSSSLDFGLINMNLLIKSRSSVLFVYWGGLLEFE